MSRKLEVQTQRLELLTAQSMANENTLVRQPTPVDMPYNAPYADEGDEVMRFVLYKYYLYLKHRYIPQRTEQF